MRISDWSSDVCSSDLKQTATLTYVDLIESRNALRFTVAIGDRRPLYCTAGGRVLLASLPDVELRRYLRGLKKQALTAETETDKRSEEHTSELQSLMRTSLAVFCLKKKLERCLPTEYT